MIIKRTEEMKADWNELKVNDRITIADAEWKVLDVQLNKILIWKCTNITDHVFNADDSNVYAGSDIQKHLQGDFRNAIPDEVLDKVTDEGFFLLSVDQIRKYMPFEIDRIATDGNDKTTWYWTSSPIVGSGGYVRYIGPTGLVDASIAISSGGVAPACWLNL